MGPVQSSLRARPAGGPVVRGSQSAPCDRGRVLGSYPDERVEQLPRTAPGFQAPNVK